MKKLRGKRIRNQILKKLFYPQHIFAMMRLSREKKVEGRTANDPQLKLYSEILKGDFLHYGYFENTDIAADAISLKDFYEAQENYAKIVIEKVPVGDDPVLDVGCGLGGLMHMLKLRECNVTGLTPDRYQIEYIKHKYPGYSLIHSTLERLDYEAYRDHFGTVVNSESLQYIKIDKGLEIIDTILKKDGQWIISDYFRKGQAHEKSGYQWDQFLEKLDENGFFVSYQQDMTQNILPTLKMIHMWGMRFGLSFFDFITGKLERKHNVVNYILTDVLNDTREYIDDHLKLIDPEQFYNDKKYMLLVIQRNK